MEPAALLAEPLSQTGGHDGGGFGVELTHLVAAVVVFSMAKVGIAALGLAPGGVRGTGFKNPRTAVHPVHEVILGRGEVSPAAQIKPDSTRVYTKLRVEFHPSDHRLTLRHHHEPRRTEGLKTEQGRRRCCLI